MAKNGLARPIRESMTLLLPVVALGVAVIALYFTYINRQTTRLVVESGELDQPAYEALIHEAEETLQRADDAVNSASLVLSFLEGFSVLAGVILVAAGVLGINSIQDLRQDTEHMMQDVLQRLEQAEKQLIERVEQAERELLNRAEMLTSLETQLEATILASQDRIDKQIAAATKNAEVAFEALSHHIMAQRLAREHNIDAAIIACREAHELDPDNMPNNYLLGTLLIRKDELDEAIIHLTEAFEDASHDSEVSSAPAEAALGLAIRKKGDQTDDVMERNLLYNRAEQHLLEATRNDPQLVNEQHEAYFGVLGSLYRRQGRDQDSIAAYERALVVTPRRSYPEINLAMLYLKLGDDTQSKIHRQRATTNALRRLEDTPDDYWARYDISLAKLLDGETEKAMEYLDDALDLTPDVMTFDSILARLYFLKGLGTPLKGINESIERIESEQKRFQSKG